MSSILVALVSLLILNASTMMIKKCVVNTTGTINRDGSIASPAGGRGVVDTTAQKATTDPITNPEPCHLYLAPSSIPDEYNRPVGFGIYTTRAIRKGEYVKPKGEGPAVLVADLSAHHHSGRNNGSVRWAKEIYMVAASAFVAETQAPPQNSSRHNSVQLFVDLGALSNHHSGLLNVCRDDHDVYRDDLLNRYKDPGAGAFSYHQGNKWYATRDVQAGEELFSDYDEGWLYGTVLRNNMFALLEIPRSEDYKAAAEILLGTMIQLKNIQSSNDTTRGNHESMNNGLRYTSRLRDYKKEAINILGYIHLQSNNNNNTTITEDDQETMNDFHKYLKTRKKKRVSNLFPQVAADFVELIMETVDKNTADEKEAEILLAKRTVLNRNVDWIRNNGRCLVNIIPKPSTISQAGMGAFAARLLKKGEIVAPAPTLVQITERKTLDMFRLHQNNYTAVGDPIGKQLLLNYCFGHEKSSMVLCPATSANLINHCGSRIKGEGHCDDRGPNARVRWATEFDPETSQWLNMSLEEIDDMVKSGRRGLSFEVVALRDIHVGEEIFIDYGQEWEEAWERHLSNWSPPPGNRTSHVSINEMNRDVDSWIRTDDEAVTNPYPIEVRVGCFDHGFHHPCDILKRGDEMESDVAANDPPARRHAVYHVRLRSLSPSAHWEVGYQWRYTNSTVETILSSRYIRFFAGSYSTDQYLTGTFRHHIGVPDAIWPDQWKNL